MQNIVLSHFAKGQLAAADLIVNLGMAVVMESNNSPTPVPDWPGVLKN